MGICQSKDFQQLFGQNENTTISSSPSTSSDMVLKVLFFPDSAFPCRYASSGCRRRNCEYAHEETNLTQFLSFLNQARTTLDICVFTITCDDIANAIQNAHGRGVVVRIITDNDQMHSNGSDIKKLAKSGIPVRPDNSPTHMHHKFCIIDDSILINGSFNWTRQAVIGNRENVMISKGPTTAIFTRYFNNLWREYQNN